MTEYRRPLMPGATWIFTVNLAERKGNRLLIDKLDKLRSAIRSVQLAHPFRIDAVVILPEHLHCIWTLPPRDADFATRWGLIKGQFSRYIDKGERVSPSRSKRGERGLWQRRFWEHLIRDENDLSAHIDYIHWNPVKHGWAQRVADWPHSSFHTYVRRGVYTEDWGGVVQIPDLFVSLPAEDAQREFNHELEMIRSLCLKLLAKRRLADAAQRATA